MVRANIESSDKIVRELFERSGRKVSFEQDGIILHPDDDSNGLYLITEGYAKIYSVTNRGEEYVHLIYDRGEIFPVLSLIKGTRRNVFHQALTPCTLLYIDNETLSRELLSDPIVTFSILQRVVEQFKVYGDRIDNLEYKYARERVAYRLLFLASRFGAKQDDTYVLQAPLTQQTIGSSINLSRESASREIERFAKKGMLRYNGRQLIITDVKGLMGEIRQPVSPDWWGLLYPEESRQ